MTLLKQGSRGSAVKSLQKQLNKVYKPSKIKIDGIFGPNTEKVVKGFQKKQKLKVDGKVGRNTFRALVEADGQKGANNGQEKTVGYKLTVKGKKEEMTKKDYEAGKQQILKDVRRGLLVAIKNRASECRIYYDHFKELNSDQWFVSSLIELSSGANLPSESLIAKAEAAAKRVEGAINSGDLVKLEKELIASEKPINEAVTKMREYQKKVIGSGENWVTGLEITRDVSFTIVSTWATAGAGSVAAAAYAGGSVALLKASSGQVGKLIANPSKSPSSKDLWNIIVDTGIGALSSGFSKGEFGKKIISGASNAIVKTLAKKFPGLSAKVLEGWVAKYMMNVGASTFEEACIQVVKQLKAGAKWSDVYQGVVTKMLSSAMFGPFEKVLEGKNFAPKVVSMITKKNKDFFQIQEKGLNVLLTDRKAIELVVKFINKSSETLGEKLVLEKVAKKLTGKETPKQFSEALVKEFISNDKAMKKLKAYLKQAKKP